MIHPCWARCLSVCLSMCVCVCVFAVSCRRKSQETAVVLSSSWSLWIIIVDRLYSDLFIEFSVCPSSRSILFDQSGCNSFLYVQVDEWQLPSITFVSVPLSTNEHYWSSSSLNEQIYRVKHYTKWTHRCQHTNTKVRLLSSVYNLIGMTREVPHMDILLVVLLGFLSFFLLLSCLFLFLFEEYLSCRLFSYVCIWFAVVIIHKEE
jgi:hypothetical protein